jgi:hypothetical protein
MINLKSSFQSLPSPPCKRVAVDSYDPRIARCIDIDHTIRESIRLAIPPHLKPSCCIASASRRNQSHRESLLFFTSLYFILSNPLPRENRRPFSNLYPSLLFSTFLYSIPPNPRPAIWAARRQRRMTAA